MASIGTFGRKYDRIDLDFEFFELTVRVNPSVSKAAMVEFLAEAGTVDMQDEVRASQVIMATLRECIHPDDFASFWTVAKRERQDPETDLMPLAQQIMEAVTAFPTGQSSASPSGDSSTPLRSVVDVPLPDSAPPLSAVALRAIQLQHGRPDLQLAVPEVARAGARSA
jgi:hypothetical protein